MRVAALYDVHGNVPALEAVLRDVALEAPDIVLVGGDVSAGPFPGETLEMLRELGDRARFVRGNADRELDAWCASQLAAEQRKFLAGLPLSVVLEVDGLGPTLFCHATPRSDDEIITAETSVDRLLPVLAGVGERVVVCGHTHMPFDREIAGTRLVNAGSVGMPYGHPGAHWTLLGPDVHLRHVDYDLESAAERIRASGWPKANEFVATNVLTVPSADEAVEFFERIAATEAGEPR